MKLLRRLFQADLRSLAAMRICTGAVLLVESVYRWVNSDLRVLYSDQGVLARSTLLENLNPYYFSLNFANGTAIFQKALDVGFGISAFCLMIGYRTRLSTLIAWVLVVSMQNRHPMFRMPHGGLYVVALFWGLFLPWERRWSVDSGSLEAPRSQEVCTTATFAYLIQVFCIYLFAGLSKTGPEWADGTAVYNVLNIDFFSSHFGRSLTRFPDMLRQTAFAVRYLEIIGPLFFFAPVLNGPLRTMATLVFCLIHLGFFCCMNIYTVPWISITVTLGVFPGYFWETAERVGGALAGRRALQVLGRIRERIAALPERVSNGWRVSEFRSVLARVRDGFLVVFPVLMAAYVVVWNFDALDDPPWRLPDGLRWIGFVTRMDQNWNMFARNTAFESGLWFTIPGRLKSGDRVDLFNKDVRQPQGPPFSEMRNLNSYPYQRYLTQIVTGRMMGTSWPAIFADYLCREWNSGHEGGDRLEEIEIAYYSKNTLSDRRIAISPRTTILRRSCH